MSTPFDVLSDEDRDRLRERDHPQWTTPMLAVLADEPFSDPDWLYERKLDGERSLAFRNGDELRLRSRNRKDQYTSYPEIAEALARQPAEDFVVDGEVVAFEGDVTSFSRLQKRMQLEDPEEARATGIAVYYYAFDILHLDGRDTSKLPLRHRKTLLKEALDFEDPVRFLTHRNEEGEAFLEEACRKGWEGVIAKKADGPYRHSRSRDWLKLKCVSQQEFVIGGWTDPEGERIGFGALLIGYYDDGDLIYAGKVGTRGEIEASTRRHRRHTATELAYRGRRVMVDAGEDWLGHLDEVAPHAIVVTHAHPDHAFGLKDGAPCPVYAPEEVWDEIGDYAIESRHQVGKRRARTIEGMTFEAFPVEHSTRAPAVGYRVSAGVITVFYAPDLVYIEDRADALRGADVYIGDGATLTRSFVRKRGDRLIGHTPVRTQLTWCRKEGVPRAIITHCGSEIVEGDERTLGAKLRAMAKERGVEAEIAHDGMEVVLR